MKSYSELILNTALQTTPKEVWKPIRGYTGLYAVSNIGRIKSFGKITHRRKNIIMNPRIYGGWPSVELQGENVKRKSFPIHRLVAEAFIPNPDKKPDVIHKNGMKHVNEVWNLQWATEKENYFNARKNGRQNNKLNESDIRWIIKIREEKNMQYKDIAAALHVKKHVIADVFRRLRKNGEMYDKRKIQI